MVGHWRKGVKHADAFTPGIADLSGYIPKKGTVWIELKSLDDWPKRPGTVVKFEFDDLQRDFLYERHGWLLCRVRREYLLFDYIDAYQIVDTPYATQERLRAAARIWRNAINWKEFTRCLKRDTLTV